MKKSSLAVLLILLIGILTFVSCSSDDVGGDGGYSGSYGSIEYCGQTYKTVVIGTQTWFAENVNCPTDENSIWNFWDCYNNDPSNCSKYGRLYDWYTARVACPNGWHLPNVNEWRMLIDAVGGSSIAGKHLKSTSGWNDNGNGDNKYGFSALPAGYGISEGFSGVGFQGVWWSADELCCGNPFNNFAYHYFTKYNADSISLSSRSYDYKSVLNSVRCVKN